MRRPPMTWASIRADPQSLDQVLDFLGRMRPPNSLNLIAYRRASGAVVAGEPLAALPPSVAALLRDRGPGDATPDLSLLRLQSRSIEQPVPIRGSVQLIWKSCRTTGERYRACHPRRGAFLRGAPRLGPPLGRGDGEDLDVRLGRGLLRRRGAGSSP